MGKFGLILVFAIALIACQSREPQASKVAGAATTKPANLAESVVSVSELVSAPKQAKLDLRLPQDAVVITAEVWNDGGRDRYGVKDWFGSDQGREASRLKLKSKLLLKENAMTEKTVSSYADSVAGAEVGFEYKTR